MDDFEVKRIKAKKLEEMQNQRLEIEINDSTFEKKILEQSKMIPIVVDFWAQWCAPCLILGPMLEKLVKEFAGKFVLAKLNVDKNPIASKNYGISSIPAVKLFKDGKVIDEFVGALPESTVKQWLLKSL